MNTVAKKACCIIPYKPTSIQAQGVVDKYEEIGYKVVKDYKEIFEIKVKEAFPDLLGRLDRGIN